MWVKSQGLNLPLNYICFTGRSVSVGNIPEALVMRDPGTQSNVILYGYKNLLKIYYLIGIENL